MNAFFKWVRTRQPSPGAQAYAFIQQTYLPAAASTGNIYMRGLRPTPLAPQPLTTATVTNAGYGGLSAGQLFHQGLLDPNSQNATPANQ